MHPEVQQFVTTAIGDRHFNRVIDVGGRNVNGHVRDIPTWSQWLSIDLEPGPGVDVIADCRDWTPPWPADLVICCEVLEHAPDPGGVTDACVSFLKRGGRLVLTCAGPGRAPHSGHDGWEVQPDEHYANIDPDWLRMVLERHLRDVQVTFNADHCDVYATGVKP